MMTMSTTTSFPHCVTQKNDVMRLGYFRVISLLLRLFCCLNKVKIRFPEHEAPHVIGNEGFPTLLILKAFSLMYYLLNFMLNATFLFSTRFLVFTRTIT